MTMTPVRPDEQLHEEPVTDAADGTPVRSPGFRLALLVALVVVLVAGLARSGVPAVDARRRTPSASAATRRSSRATARP